ncbi:carbohydrate-binding protein [Actinacidiphila sp. bgisy167]|uniref:carbohydrate-binding protein n=1 Tax=Actinacidiphila sp. bgisy167 TaxID=3413797 RepID=UPI003D73A9DC
MTAGNNGAPEPEGDDPFAYLYRQDGDEPGQPAAAQPGVPRTSYNQVQRVGERRPQQPQQPQQQPGYGYPQQQPGYGQQQSGHGQQQPGYGPPQPGYGQQHQQFPQGPGGPSGPSGPGAGGPSGPSGPGAGGSRRDAAPRAGGPNSKSLLIGAVAVVAAVAIGIGVAMAGGDDDKPQAGGATSSPTAPADTGTDDTTTEPSAPATATAPGVVDAATLVPAGGARVGSQYKGTMAAGGKYIENMNAVGASVTWKVEVPKDGSYDFWLRYNNAEKDSASATIVVNGSPQSYKPDLRNYGKKGDWNHWYRSYATLDLKQGTNTLAVTCAQGDACHFNLDQLALLDKGQAPEGW